MEIIVQSKFSLYVFFGSTKILVAMAKEEFKRPFCETWINSAEPDHTQQGTVSDHVLYCLLIGCTLDVPVFLRKHIVT